MLELIGEGIVKNNGMFWTIWTLLTQTCTPCRHNISCVIYSFAAKLGKRNLHKSASKCPNDKVPNQHKIFFSCFRSKIVLFECFLADCAVNLYFMALFTCLFLFCIIFNCLIVRAHFIKNGHFDHTL